MVGTSSPDRCSAPSTETTAPWAERQSPLGRAALVDSFTPLVRRTAARLFARRIGGEMEFGDFVQFGMVGLLEAIDRYSPARGVRFETFATYRIEGAILNGVPAMSEYQRQAHTRRGLMTQRTESLSTQASPSNDPLARLAEIAIGIALGLALEDTALYVDGEPSTPDNCYTRLELQQLREQLGQLLDGLPQQERLVLTRHYYQQQPFESIATTLGLTKGRISQIHHAGLRSLREQLRSTRGWSRKA